MSAKSREFFDQAKGIEAAVVRQADMANVPANMPEQANKGLMGALMDRLKDIPGEVGQEMKHQVAHGAAELASALNIGSGFVQYPHNAEHDQRKEKEVEKEQGREL